MNIKFINKKMNNIKFNKINKKQLKLKIIINF